METAVMAAPYISAGMTGLGGMQSASAEQANNALQYRQGLMNQELQSDRDGENSESSRQMNIEERAHRERLLKMMTEGYSDDATGVRTRYIPGQGTVTSYNGDASDMIGAERNENMQRITGDQIASRRGRQANERRRFAEGSSADSVLGEMDSPDPFDSKRIIADLIRSRRSGVNEGFDKTQSAQITSDIRTGTGSNAMLAELAKARGTALSDAEAGGYTEGLGVTEDLRNARTSRLGNKYNMLASRASNTDDVAFQPQNLTASGQTAAGGIRGSGGQPMLVSPSGRAQAALFDPSLSKQNKQGAQNSQIMGALFERVGEQAKSDRLIKSTSSYSS